MHPRNYDPVWCLGFRGLGFRVFTMGTPQAAPLILGNFPFVCRISWKGKRWSWTAGPSTLREGQFRFLGLGFRV